MSISFNHPKDTLTSTGSLNIIVLGGTPAAPRPIRLSASSVIMPVRALPTGEAGSMVFDTASKTMKYHDGTRWIELQSASDIIAPIEISLQDIYNKLNTKVQSVTYTSSAVASATISGTNLNIVFPLPSSSGGTGPTGLFTSSKPGSIMQYALTSGQSVASIREQMSGVVNGQAGRNGSASLPWKTSDGWCFSDGMYWTWEGQNGTVVKQVPNLNQEAYLKPMSLTGLTKTDIPIGSSGTTTSVALTIAQLPAHSFTVSGQTSEAGEHIHRFPLSNQKSGTGWADGATPNRFDGYGYVEASGNHIHTFAGTTNTIGQGQGHSHGIQNVDVAHFNVAVLYNIAEGTVALSETVANSRYVLKTGDIMSGALTTANSLAVRGSATSLTMFFQNASGGERAAITHNSANNTLRLRSAGGTEVTINSAGGLTAASLSGTALNVTTASAVVNGQNIVRSVNGTTANASGEVTISAGIQDIRLGVQVQVTTRNTAMLPAGYVAVGSHSNYNDNNWEMDTMYGCPIEKQVNGQWYVVNKL